MEFVALLNGREKLWGARIDCLELEIELMEGNLRHVAWEGVAWEFDFPKSEREERDVTGKE